MPLPIDDATTTRRRLTTYYSVALLIVASMLVLGFVTLSWQLGKNQGDAKLINVSGRQRMLSQRISLLSSSLLDPDKEQVRPGLRDDLLGAIELMQTSQDWLTGTVNDASTGMANEPTVEAHNTNANRESASSHPMSATLRTLYFGDDGVHTLVTAHLADAKRLAAIVDADGSTSEARTLATAIHDRAISNGMLDKLDRIVEQYESEAELKLKRFWWLEFLFLMVGLIALAAEAILIFRPMVRSAVKSLSELQSANDELVEFSYRISHDLRAPILSSIGILEITKDALNQNDVEEAKESLSHIGNALNRVSATSDDIVQLTKLRMTDVEDETFRLTQVIQESLADLAGMPGYSDVTINTEVDDCDLIHTKRTLVQQSIKNLVSNAIRYHDPNVDSPVAEIKATVHDGTCVISVSDNGLGIAAEYHSKLFSMFQRFHPKVSLGSGLGLYLVKQNAAALEGEASYTPRDKGSRFTISFPVQAGTKNS
ncbi:Type IV pili methyl-accepting chemotaxis transducer N-term [Neorhodopirellula lusitana]|uniref:histidine kinase n=1 Tax=Neorhodopirellula lusitana TaxID=445327 RepID=A0ABY1QF49_9BACT|nr:ATP-binding protein [Neorhodopirellula lusitana]SMP67304.1 Type IV pili methyl-accepting chemotaxis transducer N-term [Neorhodopirellula lusitana]